MQHWKHTTQDANRLFEQGELVDAREHYLQALALAQVLFAGAAVGPALLPLMVFHQIQLMVCAVLARRYHEQGH